MGVLESKSQNLAKFHSPKARLVSDEFSYKKKFFEEISRNERPEKGQSYREARKSATEGFGGHRAQSGRRGASESASESASAQSTNRAKSARNESASAKSTNESAKSATDHLLSTLAEKQARLRQTKKQAELLEFEIMEVQAQLGVCAGASKASIFDAPGELRKTVSTLFQSPTKPDLRHQASAFFALRPELKTKASMMLHEVRERIDELLAELESITRKGTHLARDIFASLSPNKAPHTSFLEEGLCAGDTSILLSEDSYDESGGPGNFIDIDDYESSEGETEVREWK